VTEELVRELTDTLKLCLCCSLDDCDEEDDGCAWRQAGEKERQGTVAEWVEGFLEEKGGGTYREILEGLGLDGRGSLANTLTIMWRRGQVERVPTRKWGGRFIGIR
jgi:hypothetical protein